MERPYRDRRGWKMERERERLDLSPFLEKEKRCKSRVNRERREKKEQYLPGGSSMLFSY